MKVYHNSKLDKRLVPLLKYTNPKEYEKIIKEILPEEYGDKYYSFEVGKWLKILPKETKKALKEKRIWKRIEFS